MDILLTIATMLENEKIFAWRPFQDEKKDDS